MTNYTATDNTTTLPSEGGIILADNGGCTLVATDALSFEGLKAMFR